MSTFLGLHLYQFVVLALSAVMFVDAIERFIRGGRNQSWLKLFTRLGVWGSMALVALFPTVTYWLASFVGLEGNINAVILIGFLFVFLIIFRILSVIERIEHEITTLVRREALQKFKDSNNEQSDD